MISDCLLKIDGIDGESSQNGHEKWIEMLSWNWSEANTGSSSIGSGGGSGKVSMQDFEFRMNYGISSPKLMLLCATGVHIPSATLHLRKAGGDQHIYMAWKFTDVLVSSYTAQIGDDIAGNDPLGEGRSRATHLLPVETISFNFTKIEVEYRPQTKTGAMGPALKVGFDVKTGSKV